MTKITFVPGDIVEIMYWGEWEGNYTVIATTGARTEYHIVLRNPKNGVLFEHFNDAPYNTRKVN